MLLNSVCLSVYLSVWLYTCLFLCPSVCLSVCPFVRLSFYLPVWLSVYMTIIICSLMTILSILKHVQTSDYYAMLCYTFLTSKKLIIIPLSYMPSSLYSHLIMTSAQSSLLSCSIELTNEISSLIAYNFHLFCLISVTLLSEKAMG